MTQDDIKDLMDEANGIIVVDASAVEVREGGMVYPAAVEADGSPVQARFIGEGDTLPPVKFLTLTADGIERYSKQRTTEIEAKIIGGKPTCEPLDVWSEGAESLPGVPS